MKLLGKAWTALDAYTKQQYKDKAAKNMAEYKAKYGDDAVVKYNYKEELKKKRKSAKEEGGSDKSRPVKDPNYPKRSGM